MKTQWSNTEKAQFAKMSVVVLSPIMKAEPKWVRALTRMVAFSWMHGLRVLNMGITEGMVVDWARNSLARSAMDHRDEYTDKHYSHFLWLDSDHVFEPDLALCLARHFINKDVDGVSAVYYSRTGYPLPVVYVKDVTDSKYKHYPLIEVPACLCEVDAFGFGACLIKRQTFASTPEPWFTIDAKAGEDIAFCVHAKEHGARFFVDGGYHLGHIGEAPVITKQDFEKHLAENTHLYADKVRVGLGGKVNGNMG